MKHRKTVLSWHALLLILALLASCTSKTAPSPEPTLGLQNPKSLATLFISPTPELQAQVTPTGTPASIYPTPTVTPYVGVFLGAPGPIVIDIEGTISPPTSAPPPIAPPASAPGACTTAPAPPFEHTWTFNTALQEALGCPVNSGFSLGLVHQTFERGHMFYRETGDIYALSTQSLQQGNPTDIYWHVIDTWQEGQPESDPALEPPGGLMQPIRGFGNAWRNTPAVRDALGWATTSERWFDSSWQDFAGGWMMTGPDGQVFALATVGAGGTGIHFGTQP